MHTFIRVLYVSVSCFFDDILKIVLKFDTEYDPSCNSKYSSSRVSEISNVLFLCYFFCGFPCLVDTKI